MKITTKLWMGIGFLVFLSPLGLWLPECFKAGDAWGEWGTDTVKELTGYIPRGLEKFSSLWKSPLPDYAFNGSEEKGLVFLSFDYVISAIIGVSVTVCAVFLVSRFLKMKED
jgi:hypothetical protein